MSKNRKKLQKGSGTPKTPLNDKSVLKCSNSDSSAVFARDVTAASSNWNAFLKMTGSRDTRTEKRAAGEVTSLSSSVTSDRSIAPGQCSCHTPVWFDGVDPQLLIDADQQLCESCCQRSPLEGANEKTIPTGKSPQLTRYLAIDCEMVGVGNGGVDNALARVSIVNALGQPVYDKYVKPKERVTDYRTEVSGVRPKHLTKAEKFETVQREVHDLIRGRVLVGHALHNDLRVLLLTHPKPMVRDTANFKPFRRMFDGRIPSLKNLSYKVLALEIQDGEHDSVQDARAAMRLYQTYRREWETLLDVRRRASGAQKKHNHLPD